MIQDYDRAVRWGAFPDDVSNGHWQNDPQSTIDAHEKYAAIKRLEADIDAAALKLTHLVGGLTIQAMLAGNSHPPAAQSCEFNFIDELAKRVKDIGGPVDSKELCLSPRHAATLADMRSVAQRLRPMWHVTKGERPGNSLLEALGLPYKGKLMTGAPRGALMKGKKK